MYVVTQTNGRLVLAGAAFCLLTVMCTRETLTDTLTESAPQGSPAEEEEENDDNNNNNNNDEDNNDEDRPQPGDESGAAGRANRLPLSRIKALMKADPDVSLASQESVFIIAKATELFVQMIAKDALVYTQQGKRKTLQRKDLDNAIEAVDELAFLEGTLD